ncbi:dihydrolipoyl dehydrogenase family protein [Geobacillus kaustophilus]|nr:FAD-dependent oxidoreductase [Geobacillus kaustophilus]
MKQYDLIVIGGGAGGLTVAAGAASLGARVALIEKETHLGGDCLHFGCVPSKALIKVASEIYEAKKVREWGMNIEGNINLNQVTQRIKAAIMHIQHHDDIDRFKKLGVDVYIGKGKLRSAHHVWINDEETIFGKRIVISTGSRPFVPQIDGLEKVNYLTNETIFNIDFVPKKLLVIGGGPIGIELAQAMARLGSEVIVIERSNEILQQEDEEIVQLVKKQLMRELTIYTNASIQKIIATENNKKIAVIHTQDREIEMEVTDILIASGRVPNTDTIDLDRAGVQYDNKGHIIVNEYLQTNVPTIYAIGDVNGKFPFTHVAGMEGKLVVQNAVLGLKRKINYSNVPWVTFTHPEIFHIGLTEQQARQQHDHIHIFKTPLSTVDRFVADFQTEGMVKIITDKKGYIIGAHAVGQNAGDWMQEVVFAKQFGKKIGQLSHVIHPYPTHVAAVQHTADLYWREKLFRGWIPKLVKQYIRLFR